MTGAEGALWRRLADFPLDTPGAELPFSARLARENQWSPAWTRRVMAEYKRFVFLGQVAGHPVTPSVMVDEVWHLHLTYSENYWRVFCPTVLGRDFHHHPTRGGGEETQKFADWYTRTLASYAAWFGEPAPADIWPPAEAPRRGPAPEWIRLDRARHWVIPKPSWPRWQPAGALALLVMVAVLGSAAMTPRSPNVFDWRGPDFLVFYVFFLGGAFVLAGWLRRRFAGPSAPAPVPVPELTPYQVAFLNGGSRLAVSAAIAQLVRRGELRLGPRRGRLERTAVAPAFSDPLEARLYDAVGRGEAVPVRRVLAAGRPGAEVLQADLRRRGLLASAPKAAWGMLVPLAVLALALAVGGIKIVVGLSRERPVAILAALVIMGLVAGLVAFARPLRRTRLGSAVLRQLRARHAAGRLLCKQAVPLPEAEFPLLLGLFGWEALQTPELLPLRRVLWPGASTAGAGGSGGDGGCGGGGCGGGGGGGGCGGCGGGGG